MKNCVLIPTSEGHCLIDPEMVQLIYDIATSGDGKSKSAIKYSGIDCTMIYTSITCKEIYEKLTEPSVITEDGMN